MPRNIALLFLCSILLFINLHCRIYAGAETASSVWTAMGPGSQLNICRELLRAADWEDILSNKDSIYSLVAPTNEAFLKMGAGRLQELTEPAHLEELRFIFSKHIYKGFLGIDEMTASGKTTPSIGGYKFLISGSATKWYIGRAQVLRNAIVASNGIVYVVDDVLE